MKNINNINECGNDDPQEQAGGMIVITHDRGVVKNH
jgi:hypothetical protein